MPRLILALRSGARTASIRQQAIADPAVDDAVEAQVANAVIVEVPRVTTDVRQRLAAIPGVDRVEDDIQALPLVADDEATRDFLRTVRAHRGERDAPPLVATKPTREEDDDLLSDGGAPTVAANAPPAQPGPEATIANIDDSVTYTGAEDLHTQGIRGDSVICVNVDLGGCSSAIATERQLAGADLSGENDPWTQLGGHGPYTLGIMAGGTETPGVGLGYAPASDCFPIKTTLAGSEIVQAQDIIVNLADNTGKWVIVNNSWGFVQCDGLCDLTVTQAIATAADHPRVVQVFAAGNEATGDADCGEQCDGTTVGISGPNSLDNVLSVAATGRDGDTNTLMPYSSRGGSGTVSCGTEKPDLAAPIFGTVPWGCDQTDIGNSGGTSGAAPQVAGAVALLLDEIGDTNQGAVFGSVEDAALQFQGSGFNGCTGWGNLQAAGALDVPTAVEAGVPRASKFIAAGVALGFAGAIFQRALAS